MIKLDDIRKNELEDFDSTERYLTAWIDGDETELFEFLESSQFDGYIEDDCLVLDIVFSYGSMTEAKKDIKSEIKQWNKSH